MSKYLGKCVFAALVAMGSANAYAQVQVNCTSSCYEYPTQGGGEDPGWDQGGSGDGGETGNGTGGGNDSDPAQELARMQACLELHEKGLPEGCNPALAIAGTPRPVFSQPSTLTSMYSSEIGRAHV